MPLKKGYSEATFKYNFEKSLKEGKSKKQSLAIAYSIQNKAKKKK